VIPVRRGRGAEPAASAVVVNYNAGAHLLTCVASLRADGVDDVVVVDNGSEDGSVGVLRTADPAVRVLRPERNLGFGAGANSGLAHVKGEFVLVCNPDLVVHPGCVPALVAAASTNPDVAVVGPKIMDSDGARYPSARAFPQLADAFGHAFVGLFSERNRWTRRYKLPEPDDGGGGPVDWVSGACFLARREALSSVGGFDEAYFMYVEDVDLCWRLRRAGWSTRYEPGAVVTHVQGVSTARHPYRMAAAHHRSMWRFAVRSTTGARRAALPLVAIGIAVRFVLVCGMRAASARPARRRAPSGRAQAGASRG
jgi:N-acetylglucosaminyl-diphospho-decaprenol L-rhamnosyltransferase